MRVYTIPKRRVKRIIKPNTIRTPASKLRNKKDPNRYYTPFAQELYRRRVELGLSQSDLSRKSGVSRRSILNYENSDRSDPQVSILYKLAQVLGLTMETLWRGHRDEA